MIQIIIDLLHQLWCGLVHGHERESNGIEDGTFCESNGWCKRCGKPM